MKIESDTFVCIICIAAFIGYTLGIQHVITNVMKTPQQSNKVHKITQTNLSDLAEILASNHMIIRHSYNSNDEMCDDAKLEDAKLEDVKIENVEDKCNEKINENVSDVIINNSGNTNNINNSEEEYEVITGNTKKLYTKNQSRHYFGWFDSMF
jgi:argininosuccinate lyase